VLYKVRLVTIDADAVRSEVYNINQPEPSVGS
jgi:hypothetical protein